MQDQIAMLENLCADIRRSLLTSLLLALTLVLLAVSSAQAQTDSVLQPSAGARDTAAAPDDPPTRSRRSATQTPSRRSSSAKKASPVASAKSEAEFKALSEMINLYVQDKRFGRAHDQLDLAIAADPNNAPLHYLKAQVYGVEKKEKEVESELRRALKINPNYLPAYFSLAAVYTNTNQPDRAITELREIIARKPNDPTPYTLIGMLEHKRDNINEAMKNYRQAIAADPNAVIAANNLAALYAEHDEKKLDEATQLAQGIVVKHPDQPGFLDTLGWIYYKKGLYDPAIEQLQKAVARDGGNPLYRYHLGMALAGKGDEAESRRQLQLASLLDKDKTLAKLETANQKTPRVKVKVEEPPPLMPTKTNDGDRINELREQIEGAKSDERARLQRSLVDQFIKLDRKKEAIDELRLMTREERFDPVGFYNIGNALARLGDTDTAIDAYRKAISQRQGNYARALNNLGVVLLRQGRWDEAQQALTAALKLESFRYSEASYNLGRLYSMRGEADLAIREWKQALKVQPDHKDAAIALARAYAEDGSPERGLIVLDNLLARGESSSEVASVRRQIMLTDPEANTISVSAKPSTVINTSGTSASNSSSRSRARLTSSRPSSRAAAATLRPITVDPETYELLQRARAAREEGRYEDAVKDYRRVLMQRGGFFPPANLEMSFALINLKRNDEAIAALQVLTAKEGARYPIAYYHLGRLYELQGQLKLAAENFERAAAAYGDTNPQFLLDVSRVREKEGNFGAALEAMEAYARANERLGRKPDWSEARLTELRKKVATSAKSPAPKP